MAKKTVWTKQHKNVLATLENEGRYVAKKAFIEKDLGEHASLVLEVYDWFVSEAAKRYEKPADVSYPIWTSLFSDGTMIKSPDTVILELEVEEELLMPVNIDKWGTMLNYSYIPENEQDKVRHLKLLESYGVSDAKAYMTEFYPIIKKEIVESWPRLFDSSIIINNEEQYATLWELKREWLKKVEQ